MKPARGFTLLELMIVSAITSLGILGMSALVTQLQTVQRRWNYLGDAQNQAQALAKEVAITVRRASLGAQSGTFSMAASSNIAQHGVMFSDLAPCGAVTPTVPDKLYILTAEPVSPAVVLTAPALTTTAGSLTVNATSGLAVNDFILLNDYRRGALMRVQGLGGTSITTIEQGGVVELFPRDTPGFKAGAPVYKAKMIRFSVAADSAGVNWLYMDNVDPRTKGSVPVLSKKLFSFVENLQFAYGVDDTGDDVIDRWVNFVCSDDTTTIPNIRQVRVSVVTQSSGKLDYMVKAGYGDPSPAIEDYPAATHSDGFVRRWIQASATVRNMIGVAR